MGRDHFERTIDKITYMLSNSRNLLWKFSFCFFFFLKQDFPGSLLKTTTSFCWLDDVDKVFINKHLFQKDFSNKIFSFLAANGEDFLLQVNVL